VRLYLDNRLGGLFLFRCKQIGWTSMRYSYCSVAEASPTLDNFMDRALETMDGELLSFPLKDSEANLGLSVQSRKLLYLKGR